MEEVLQKSRTVVASVTDTLTNIWTSSAAVAAKNIIFFQGALLHTGIDFISKQITQNNFNTVFVDIKKYNVYNMLVSVSHPLIPKLFQESRSEN